MMRSPARQLLILIATALFLAAVAFAWQRHGMATVTAQGASWFAYTRSWGTRGNGPGQFQAPVAVAVDLDGNIHVLDRDNGRIQKFDPAGTFLLAYPGLSGGLIRPTGLGLGPWGYIYVPDANYQGIWYYRNDGHQIGGWNDIGKSWQFYEPWNAAGSDYAGGQVFVVDRFYCKLYRFSYTGNYIGGRGICGSGEADLQSPLDVATYLSSDYRNHFVYVADTGNHRIQKRYDHLSWIMNWGGLGAGDGQFDAPASVATDGHGRVYVGDTGNHRVQVFDDEGRFITKFGSFGGGPGQLNSPQGIAVGQDGCVYVADTGNDRIVVFCPTTPLPTFTPVPPTATPTQQPTATRTTAPTPTGTPRPTATPTPTTTPVISLVDTDGDGLPDEWEINGYNGVDLRAMGADPRHKDIFIEVDWMHGDVCLGPTCYGYVQHRPKDEAMAMVIEAFRRAPVPNPNGVPGITLHIDYGPNTVMDPRTGRLWGGQSRSEGVALLEKLSDQEFYGIVRWYHFPLERRRIFHYALFAHYPPGWCTTGRGWDSEFIVTLGGWGRLANDDVEKNFCWLHPTATGTIQQQAGTFMHELGHNLNLNHGGDTVVGSKEGTNNKPNHLSVMNYWYQTRGLTYLGAEGHLDYSRFEGVVLDEDDLNERLGFAAPSMRDYGARWDCGLLGNRWTAHVNEPINWDCLLGADGEHIRADVNGDGLRFHLRTTNEWDAIELGRGCIGPWEDDHSWCPERPQTGLISTGIVAAIPEPPPSLSIEEDMRLHTPYFVSVVAEPVVVGGEPSRTTYEFTVRNSGLFTDTYTLETQVEGGWGDFIEAPGEINLGPGAEYRLRVTLAAPASAPAGSQARASLKAISKTHPAIVDSYTVDARILWRTYIPAVTR